MKPVPFPGSNTTIAKDQPQYLPLAARILKDGTVITRWEFSAEEINRIRAQLLDPAASEQGSAAPLGVFLTQLTFGQPLQPQLVTLDQPPPCFEALPADREVPDAIQRLANLAGNRGAKILFAMDNKSTPGKCICHFLQMESIEFDEGADFDETQMNTLHPDSDRRLAALASCFTGGERQAMVNLLKALSVAAGNIAAVRQNCIVPKGLDHSLQNCLKLIDQVVQTHA